MTDSNDNNAQLRNWEKEAILSMLGEFVKDKKRRRRWTWFYRILVIIILLLILWGLAPDEPTKFSKPHVSVVDIDGAIMADSPYSAKNIIDGLDQAFKDKNTKAVMLHINSPGGSAVEAAEVYDAINRFRDEYKGIKVYAVCTDICASGAYYIASAADDIYANPASMVGSIGVLINGFGFVDTLHKIGVQRRLITAGKYKGFLDPFSPMNSEEKQFAQQMVDIVHTQFIDAVKKGRGKRLKLNTPNLFSGLIWTGSQAQKYGLIDGFGSPSSVAKNVIKVDNMVNYTEKPGYFQRLSDTFGASIARNVVAYMASPKPSFQ